LGLNCCLDCALVVSFFVLILKSLRECGDCLLQRVVWVCVDRGDEWSTGYSNGPTVPHCCNEKRGRVTQSSCCFHILAFLQVVVGGVIFSLPFAFPFFSLLFFLPHYATITSLLAIRSPRVFYRHALFWWITPRYTFSFIYSYIHIYFPRHLVHPGVTSNGYLHMYPLSSTLFLFRVLPRECRQRCD